MNHRTGPASENLPSTLPTSWQPPTDLVERLRQELPAGHPDGILNVPARRTEEEIAADPQPGDIYHTSWGYDQTNVEFFQVIERTPGTVTLRRIQADVIDRRVYPMADAWTSDWHLGLNAEGYSQKVCRLTTKIRKYQNPGEAPIMGRWLKIDDVRTAFPYAGGGEYDTLAAGYPGH